MANAPQPEWLIEEPYVDAELGVLRSGKEAQIDVIERTGEQGQRCLLARKLYIPRAATTKGELEALGVQRASAFRHDVQYREGRQFRKSRDRRAVESMSSHGKRLLQTRWTSHEYDVTTALWRAGLRVPYPVSFADDRFVMEFVGDDDGAAPQLARARLERAELESALDQVGAGLATMVGAGWAHGDLSAYNLLWWRSTLVFIDFPQAVDLAANPQGIDYLHRDALNLATWFGRQGLSVDGDELFATALGSWMP